MLSSALPDRYSIEADGAAAALLAFAADAAIPAFAAFAARRLPGLATGWRPAVVVLSCATLAVLPLVPKPLPAATATPLPPGWSAVFTSLRLPASAHVLVVPIPMSTFTEPLRWQADTGEPGSLVGGYFMGPDWNGRGYIDGNGTPTASLYLNARWLESSPGLAKVAGRGGTAKRLPQVGRFRAGQGRDRHRDARPDRGLAGDGGGRGGQTGLRARPVPHRPVRPACRRRGRRSRLARLVRTFEANETGLS